MEENNEVNEITDVNEVNDKKPIQININNTDKVLTWLEHILRLLKEYGPWKILIGTCFIVIVSWTLYFTFNFTKLFELYDAWRSRQHDSDMELRMELGPKIQNLTDKLTYYVGATRTLVLELHNGNTGNGGLPFTKCTATYESLNIGKHPVAQEYQDFNMSLMPFSHTLFDVGYWCGDLSELESIDRSLFYKMKSNGTEHFVACIIEGVNDKPIAILIVSFDKPIGLLQNHECDKTRESIRHVAMELAVVLEVTRIIVNK